MCSANELLTYPNGTLVEVLSENIGNPVFLTVCADFMLAAHKKLIFEFYVLSVEVLFFSV